MIQSVYVKDGQIKQDLSETEIRSAIDSGEGVLWVEIHGDGEYDPEPVLRDVFKFHPLAIEDCMHHRIDTPKVDDYGSYLFIIAQSVTYAEQTRAIELIEVDVFLGPNYVLTSHWQDVPVLDELLARARENEHIMFRGADFLAHTVIDSLVDLLLPAVENMDEYLDSLERRILETADKSLITDLMAIKRNTLRLRRAILPERDMVNRLSRGEFGAMISSEALLFYRDIYDHIVRVEEMLEGLRDIADSALSSYLSAVNNRMNEVMKAMSVVAVVFLPLTLIASIFGTNLDYSSTGLRFEHGFLLMLAAMLLVGIGTIVYFRRRGWF